MRQIGFALALLSAISMTIVPVAPSFASSEPGTMSAEQTFAKAEQTLAKHAKRGDVVVLTKDQMAQLATSHPKLHAKLSAAHQAGKMPQLSGAEKKMLQAMSSKNIDNMQAAGWSVGVIIIVVVAALFLWWMLWAPHFCKTWPWAIGCPAPARVR